MSSCSLAMIVLLAAAAALVQLAVAADPCGSPDWRYSPISNKCYRLINERTGWVVAEFKCLFMGGGSHHIAPHSSAENQFISELAKQAGIVWLGAVQYGGSKDYTWVDRTPYGDYENWQTGSRPPYHKGKKCTKLDGATGQWIQSCCKVEAAYICQKPAIVQPSQIVEDGSGLTSEIRSRRRVRSRPTRHLRHFRH